MAEKLERKVGTENRFGLHMNHKVIEIFNLSPDLLKNSESILPHIREFIAKTNLRVVKEQNHDFEPYGATLMFLLSSSHLAVHTWPERGYLHLDLFTCADLPSKELLIAELKEIFRIKKADIKIKEIKYDPKNKL